MARKILLADDSVTAQNMGRKILADAGYDVVTVNNGSAALKRITEIKPDLIVLDVYMPGYSGLEVCQRLKDAVETQHIPVLLTVGKLEPFKPEEARRVRADAHIIKPFEASELLTAIMKLEDRMVPQQADGSRFSKSVSGVERFGGDRDGKKSEGGADSDTGWKSRLRFPSKKKKEEPESEPENVEETATFRDFRKGKGKTAAGAPFTVKAPAPPGQEPGLVPDIPRDITPEELDALSALAAKLDGPIPRAENIAPLAEKMGPAATGEFASPHPQAEETVAEAPVTVPEAKSKATEEETKKEPKEEAAAPVPQVAPAAAVYALPEFPIEAPAAAAENPAQVEVPFVQIEPVTQAAPQTETVADALASEVKADQVPVQSVAASESQKPETFASVPVNTAQFAEQAAPVDRADEPMFASAANVVVQPAEEKITETAIAEAKAAEQPVEAIAESQTIAAAELESKSEAFSCAEVTKSQDLKSEEPAADESIAQPVPVAATEPESDEPSPSDEELAEALRLLTPSTGQADGTTVPTHGTLVAAGQLLAEEAALNASGGSRWMAQPVALGPDEAALSLEAEMLHAFTTMPASQTSTGSGVAEGAGITGVSAITAAVENRLAAIDLATGAKNLAEQGAAEPAMGGAEATSIQASAVETSAAANKATPFVVATAQPAAEPAVEPMPVAAEGIEASEIAVEQEAIPKVAEPEVVAAEEAAPVTFAGAMGKSEIEAAVENNAPVTSAVDSPVNGTGSSAAPEEQNQDSSPEVGSEESMGKEVKGKKSTWHQIRTTPVGVGAGSDVVEAAKQEGEAAPKAMAAMAAAAAEGSSSSVPDAGTIASIVDSVMADLRPRIVEEIAKKLAGK